MDADGVFDRVRRIPVGFVTTYGSLAPGAPRHAGRLLSEAPPDIPWWRVVRSDGSLAKGAVQHRMLAAEGVPMRGARVIMREAFVPADHVVPTTGPSGDAHTRRHRLSDVTAADAQPSAGSRGVPHGVDAG